jgi:K+-transporting ATPase ATPase A chain
MNISGWIQLALFMGLLVLITKPLGVYLFQVLDGHNTFLEPVLGPVERFTYRLLRVDERREQNWKQYSIALLLFSLVTMLFTYVILRLQDHLPFHGIIDALGNKTPITPDLAFNTAASFTTNTNWQNYSGENTMSYFSQMVGLASHNFWSAALGIAVAAALVRGIARHESRTVGNFWVDLVRLHYYLLLPLCILYAIFLMWQGVPQNFRPYDTAQLTETQTIQVPKVDAKNQPVKDAAGNVVLQDQAVATQGIVQGPIASQMAIKMLGTNGGGFVNANASHPFENPTPFSNFLQMLSIFAIPTGLTYYLGRMVKNQRHGWAVWGAMAAIFLVGAVTCWKAEADGNPNLYRNGVVQADGNMEGKETRFGIFNSALFATITTDASCGAVNSMHDSFTPVGGLVPLFNIQLGEIVFGGVGAGLYGMLIFVILAVFIAGLMVGRTPEYLGKKIQAFEVKMSGLVVLVLTLSILVFSAWAAGAANFGAPDPVTGVLTNGTNNNGPHGFSEILYAYSSCTGNNGSAFAGLSGNTPWYNTTLAFAALIGRFFMIVPIMAIAGSLGAKKLVPAGPGSFPVDGWTFIILLIGTVLLIGALNFLPALALGPVVEHFLMYTGKLF